MCKTIDISYKNIRESFAFLFFFCYYPFLLPFLKSPSTLSALQVTFSTVMFALLSPNTSRGLCFKHSFFTWPIFEISKGFQPRLNFMSCFKSRLFSKWTRIPFYNYLNFDSYSFWQLHCSFFLSISVFPFNEIYETKKIITASLKSAS